MIQTVDNYYSLPVTILKTNKDRREFLEKNSYYCLSKSAPKELYITLKDYKKHKQNFIFFDSNNSEDDLIISVKKIQTNQEENYIAQTGNYIGRFKYNDIDIEIKSRFPDIFLKRMLNFANDVYLDDVDVSGKVTKQDDLDYSKFILYYLFIQSLEKAFLLGLPKNYTTVKHHDIKLKGNIDINRFIKYDIPFKGKISSKSREQKEIQEIIDVLHKTVSIIEKSKQISTKNISHIKTHLRQHKSKNFVTNQTVQKALNSKALSNPIFAPYKKVLEYAKYIININSLEQDKNKDKKTYGFVINVAMLFELYITKLLTKEFNGWSVSSPKIRLDKENGFGSSYLYNRAIIPDIIMKHNSDNRVLVFDTKYKRMKFSQTRGNGSDIDRCDFFQINTYMSYYNNHKEYNLKVGGLLYPMEEIYDEAKCFSDNWFGNEKVKFVLDGIELHKAKSMSSLRCREKRFIRRIKNIIKQT